MIFTFSLGFEENEEVRFGYVAEDNVTWYIVSIIVSRV